MLAKHRQKDELFQIAEDVMTQILDMMQKGMKIPVELEDVIIESAETLIDGN
ncbi:MAG: hypothetical protein WAM14_00275 [Candidatus Nitrosopolaris sp.]